MFLRDRFCILRETFLLLFIPLFHYFVTAKSSVSCNEMKSFTLLPHASVRNPPQSTHANANVIDGAH